jgi:alkanesulfonate monooxygenase SsuD/methylene tetrahydromethanopterin reductase-like flavin-dependent oxidoreductase (luciferase family)
MEFGIQFFPDVRPDQKSARDYFDESLRLVELCDDYGYTHVRTVEHYFESYGGYSPSPLIFLTACAGRTEKARLITGAVLPAFNNPLKLAGEVGMVDAISKGRVEVGFARAFLPHEFHRFGVDLDESVARFDEGVAQITRLIDEENVSMDGRFHSFSELTSLPRPTQKQIPYWTAAIATPASFEKAGRAGHSVMAIPLGGGAMVELLGLYRDAWRSAGHPGNGRVMLAFHMVCHEDHGAAEDIARDNLNRYLKSLVSSASDWTSGEISKDYPHYGEIIAKLEKENYDTQMASGAAWVGTPDELVERVRDYNATAGGFEIASLQVNFNMIPFEDAARSMKLFGSKVIPHFASDAAAAAQ